MDSPQAPIRIRLPDLDATRALGARLGAILAPGDIAALTGPLGAGKTELARAAIRGRLSDPEADVPSPTFTLVQTYMAADLLEIWHVDLYRLEDEAGLEELGLEDAFETAASLIEWPDRLGALLPPERLEISLSSAGGERYADLTGFGSRWRERIDRFR